MTLLAMWLLGCAVMDLTRVWAWRPRTIPRTLADRVIQGVVAPLAGILTLLAAALACGLTTGVEFALLALLSLPLLGWWWLSESALRHTPTQRARYVALAALAAGVVLSVGLSGWMSEVGGAWARWLAWADLPPLDPARMLLLTALLAANVATANIVVRLVLIATGAMRPTIPGTERPEAADRLRGGRLLGPMERVLILGLGAAGQVTAASLVIAAKGIIRFPELVSRPSDTEEVSGVGIDAVTEYFLVGSFVSWLIALASLAVWH